ncbi:MAG TPA: DUF309 domain-containing protein [Bacteroidota bacterium]|nr:DUF309 domain-containing protein [Bacteroidota bacterium]
MRGEEALFQLNLRPKSAILSEEEKFAQGVALFNSRDFFDCHDVIEEIWMERRGKDRTFFQGIIHVAVGFYHLDNGNFRGSKSQLSKGVAKLEQYRPAYFGVELADFLGRTARCLEWVTERERGGSTESFDAAWIPTLEFVK